MMSCGVSADAEEFKVFESIIGPVAVSVMNLLPRLKASSQVLRHDDTVFKVELIADLKRDVSVRSDKSASVLDTSAAVH